MNGKENETKQLMYSSTLNWNHRRSVSAIVFLMYLFPLMLWASYTNFVKPGIFSWGLWTATFCFGLVGMIFLRTLIRRWEHFMRSKVAFLVERKVEQIRFEKESLLEPTPQPLGYDSEQIESITAPFLEEVVVLKKELDKKSLYHGQELTHLKQELHTSKEMVGTLSEENHRFKAQATQLLTEKQSLEGQCQSLKEEIKETREHSRLKLEEKRVAMQQKEQVLSQQRRTLEQAQEDMDKLKHRVGDLNFELQTLLQLKNTMQTGDSAVKQHTECFAKDELQKCIEIAEEMPGSNHSNSSPIPGGSTTVIDQRRLFECYQQIETHIIFVYSLEENRMLFVNEKVKSVLGTTPERFLHDFYKLIAESMEHWIEAISLLHEDTAGKVKLEIMDKNSNLKSFDCYLGVISAGLFEHQVVGVLEAN